MAREPGIGKSFSSVFCHFRIYCAFDRRYYVRVEFHDRRDEIIVHLTHHK